jgi:hypothetical protein
MFSLFGAIEKVGMGSLELLSAARIQVLEDARGGSLISGAD